MILSHCPMFMYWFQVEEGKVDQELPDVGTSLREKKLCLNHSYAYGKGLPAAQMMDLRRKPATLRCKFMIHLSNFCGNLK